MATSLASANKLLASESTNRISKTETIKTKELRKKSETPFAMLRWDRYAEEVITD